MEIESIDKGIDLLYGIKGPTHRQMEFRDDPARFKLYGGAMGGGKALYINTLIPTPHGWKTMGELNVGDQVFDENGIPCSILACSEVMENHPCYEVTFSDRSTIIADEEHLWVTLSQKERNNNRKRSEEFRSKRKSSRVSRGLGIRPDLGHLNTKRSLLFKGLKPIVGTIRSTVDILNTIGEKHSIQVTKPLEYTKKYLHIDPYLLGVWLGDGTSISGSITTIDNEIVVQIQNSGYKIYPVPSSKYLYRVEGLTSDLNFLGILGDKHIPLYYLQSSVSDRLALLQGLMDTDGYATKDGQCEIQLTNKKLVTDTLELILSLGIKATMNEGIARLYGKDCGKKWRIKFISDLPVFRLRKKSIRQKTSNFRGTHNLRYVNSIKQVESVLVRCIKVDSPSHCYLAGKEMIPTHNSVALCAEGLRLSLAYEGNRGFLCRHESTAFKNTTLATMLKLIEEVEGLTGQKIISNHHRTDKVIYFLNGSSIMYGALGDASDFERLKSLEIGWFGIDEASECEENNYQTLKSRLRWKLSNGEYPPFFGLLASNPEAGWVKNTFVVPQRKGAPKPNHSFIQALPKDNPYLPLDYLDILRESNPEHWVQKYIEGSWDALEGQIWPMFDFNIHILKPFSIPEEWRKFRAIDHGQSNPTCCLWFAIDPDSNIFVYREYYSPGVVSSHCSTIKSLSVGEEYISTYLPPECWGKTMEKDSRLWSVVEEYGEHSIYCTRANNEVLAGINRVGESFLIDKERIHPIHGEKGSPSLFIFNTCKNLIDEVPDYTWKSQGGDMIDKERPVKKHDHAVDALRYGVMSRPSPFASKKVLPINSFSEVRKRLISAKRMAGKGKGTVHEIYEKMGKGY